jgi:hypothetical protein
MERMSSRTISVGSGPHKHSSSVDPLSNPSFGEALCEVFAFHQLHRQCDHSARVLEPVDRGDMRMRPLRRVAALRDSRCGPRHPHRRRERSRGRGARLGLATCPPCQPLPHCSLGLSDEPDFHHLEPRRGGAEGILVSPSSRSRCRSSGPSRRTQTPPISFRSGTVCRSPV